MPLTQIQLEARIANDLINKYVDVMTWGDVVSGAQSASAADKAEITSAFKKRNFAVMGKTLGKLILAELLSQAEDEAATILADGQLSVTEVNRWLGDG